MRFSLNSVHKKASILHSSLKRYYLSRGLCSSVQTKCPSYNFYRSPSVLRQRKCKKVDLIANRTAADSQTNQHVVCQSRSEARKSNHNVHYWNQKPKVQYNSIDIEAPMKRSSTAGRVIYTYQVAHPQMAEGDHLPNIELHTWNTLEATQYGHEFNKAIERQSAARIRLISMKQKNVMHFTKKHN